MLIIRINRQNIGRYAVAATEKWRRSSEISSKGSKNARTEKKIKKVVVQRKQIPIMRLHRHGAVTHNRVD
ncbi:hypothetical protein, partial [Pectobacterium parmentieri]